MFVVADSGSTKTDWHFCANNNVVKQSTVGLNPFFVDANQVAGSINFNFNLQEVEHVYFYGSGCSSPSLCEIIENGLRQKFTKAKIYVEHDLLAAARATCGHYEGIACILGTGSNSCFYDGDKIKKNVPSMGYIIGDEGGGVDMGKELLRRYAYKELNAELMHQFDLMYQTSITEILNQTYKQPKPNEYLASFTTFLNDNIEHTQMQEVVLQSFTKFFQRNITKYKHYQSHYINFVGSIAIVFEQQLQQVAEQFGTTIGKTVKQPINELVAYHKTTR